MENDIACGFGKLTRIKNVPFIRVYRGKKRNWRFLFNFSSSFSRCFLIVIQWLRIVFHEACGTTKDHYKCSSHINLKCEKIVFWWTWQIENLTVFINEKTHQKLLFLKKKKNATTREAISFSSSTQKREVPF